MKRAPLRLKAAFALILVVGLGAGAALVAVKVFFPEPRARAWIVDAARRQFGRDVRLGRIDIGLRGLSLQGLEVSERPDFSAGTFLRVENFRLRPSWRALLKRRLVVSAVAADGLKVRVVEAADGRFNYETLASSSSTPAAPAPPSKPSEAEAPELNVRRALIANGTVEYADAAGGSWTLTGLDLDVSDFGQAEPFGLKTSFQIHGKAGTRPVDARVDFIGRVDLARGSREKFKATVKRLVVEQRGLKLAASGTVARLDAPVLVFDATLSAGGRELLLAGGSAKLGGAKSADVKWKTPGLDAALLAKFAPQDGIPAVSIPAAEGAFSGVFSGAGADVRSFRASWADGKLEGEGSVRGLKTGKPVYEGRAAFGFDSPEIRPGQYPFLKLPPKLALPAARLDGELTLNGDELIISTLTAKIKAGTLSAVGAVRGLSSAKPVPDVAVTADLTLPALRDKDLPFPGVPPGLQMPPSHWTAAAAYSPRLIRIKSLRAVIGRNDVEASGSVTDPSGRGAYDLLFKCRSFMLGEITRLTPQTRDLKLAGSGFFALSVTGIKGKPIYAGKLQFKDLGATVGGLPLADFAGTMSFDANRVDVPNLTGKFADGRLKMDLTVKNYALAPNIELEASLDRFDLGRYLAAKTKVVADRAAAQAGKSAKTVNPAEPAQPAKAAADEKTSLVSARGHLNIGTLVHPSATVTDVKVGWNLRGLNGDAKFHVGGGRVRSAGDMATQSKLVKVLIFPLLIVQKLGSIGGLRLFPNFNDITLNQIVGDYGFQNGVMTLRQSEMDSDAAQVSAKGTIDLPAEALDLVVTAQVGRLAPIDVAVTGTFDKPKSKVNLAKFLAAPAQQLIQGLLGR